MYRTIWWLKIIGTLGMSIYAFGILSHLFEMPDIGFLKIRNLLGIIGIYIIYLIKQSREDWTKLSASEWVRLIAIIGLTLHSFNLLSEFFDFGIGFIKIKYVLGVIGLYTFYLIRERGG